MFTRNACNILTVKNLFASLLRSGSLAFVLAVTGFVLLSPAQAQVQTPPQQSLEQSTAIGLQNQVNINTADAETLALALDGVGMSKARDIIAHREQHGVFKTVDDLQNVRGIGKATLERNRDRILVETPED